jgi:RHS repeat-associated protein
LTKLTEPDRTITTYTYDARGLPTAITRTSISDPVISYPDPTSGAGPVIVDVRPIFECWSTQPNGLLTAYFGYENLSTQAGRPVAVSVAHGPQNKLTPTPASYQGAQPDRFGVPNVVSGRPGRTAVGGARPYGFVVTDWNGKNIVWKVNNRTATASKNGAQCTGAGSGTTQSVTVTETRAYDGDGRLVRVSNSANGATTSQQLVWDVASGLDQVVATRRNNTDINYLIGNRREAAITGSTVTWQRYNALGDNVTAGVTFGPFGAPLQAAPQATWAFGYRGELTSPTGLQYLRARNYNPLTATFVAPDALDGVDGTATLSNPYHYAYNDPANREDPTGLRPTDGLFSAGAPALVQADGCTTVRQTCIDLWGLVNPGREFFDATGHDFAVAQANACANSPGLMYWKIVDRVIEQTCQFWTHQVDPSAIVVPKVYECTDNWFTWGPNKILGHWDKCFSFEKGWDAVWENKWEILKFAVNVGTFGAFGCGYDTVGGLLNDDRSQAASGVISCLTLGGASSVARAIDGVFTRVLSGNAMARLGIRQAVLGSGDNLAVWSATKLDDTPIYRGVATDHHAYDDAVQGVARPGDVNGVSDVALHNAGFTHGTDLTSWSTQLSTAEGFAGQGGVVLETTVGTLQRGGVQILRSPDAFNEAEILVKGLVGGLKVR